MTDEGSCPPFVVLPREGNETLYDELEKAISKEAEKEEEEKETIPPSPPGSPRFHAMEAEFKDLVKRSLNHLMDDKADDQDTKAYIREMEDLRNRSLLRMSEKLRELSKQKQFECCGRIFESQWAYEGRALCLRCACIKPPQVCKIHPPLPSRVHPIPKSDPITIPPRQTHFHIHPLPSATFQSAVRANYLAESELREHNGGYRWDQYRFITK